MPDSVNVVPEHAVQPGLHASLVDWEYGPTAEILHIGPYNKDVPTIQRLKDYVAAQGCELVGEHEEEYIRRPTMWGPGNPEEYLTIIRHWVRYTTKKH